MKIWVEDVWWLIHTIFAATNQSSLFRWHQIADVRVSWVSTRRKFTSSLSMKVDEEDHEEDLVSNKFQNLS